MRFLGFLLLTLSSLLAGFIFAGIPGAVLFGIINAIAWHILKKREPGKYLRKFFARLLFFSAMGYLLMMGFGLVGAGALVHQKVNEIKTELIREGYRPRWIIISQKRYEIYNQLLKNSVKNGKSRHLAGKAIDLFIIDIDNDGKYDKEDFNLIKNAEARCEKAHPETKGSVYHYFGKGRLSNHMVHVEVE